MQGPRVSGEFEVYLDGTPPSTKLLSGQYRPPTPSELADDRKKDEEHWRILGSTLNSIEAQQEALRQEIEALQASYETAFKKKDADIEALCRQPKGTFAHALGHADKDFHDARGQSVTYQVNGQHILIGRDMSSGQVRFYLEDPSGKKVFVDTLSPQEQKAIELRISEQMKIREKNGPGHELFADELTPAQKAEIYEKFKTFDDFRKTVDAMPEPERSKYMNMVFHAIDTTTKQRGEIHQKNIELNNLKEVSQTTCYADQVAPLDKKVLAASAPETPSPEGGLAGPQGPKPKNLTLGAGAG